MNARRLLPALALAAALLAPAAAQAAPTGVNVSHLDDDGDPYVKLPGNIGPGDTAQAWSDLEQSGAKLVRSFVSWNTLTGGTRDLQIAKYRGFADKANARGLRVLLTVTGAPLPQPTPAQYAAVVADLATNLKGRNVAYEVWNEPDETTFWHNGPQPAEYAALLKAAYPAIKGADPSAVVLVGGLTGNNFEFVEHLYDNGAQGSFDGVGVHTDTACLTTDPREYYREPSGRIGRYSFTGYREVRQSMLNHGDDKPVWMTELGWATTSAVCTSGARAGTKAGGVTQAEQAGFLAKAYGCLANDPWVEQAAWFNLHDLQTGSTDAALNLGLITDGFTRKPAFAAFQNAAAATPIACGGAMDSGVPQITVNSPTDGQLYVSTLPIDVTATDDQGVTDIDVVVDGKEVPLKTNRSGTGAYIKYDWGGAKNLAYGPHTVVITASDEAKNVGRVTSKVVHVGGGRFPYKVPTSYTLKVGKVKRGKVTVKGKIASKSPLISRLAHGRAYVYFSRFDTKAKRWKKVSRYSRDAKHAFKLRYTFKQRGVWRVTGSFKPKRGFKKARPKARRLKV
jgi:hypothetical protein